jgi:transposase InsO family protein
MRSRAEITSRYAKAYVKASRKDKGRVLDEVVSVTGWSRDNARRRLTEAAKRPPGSGRQVAKEPRKPRSPKYSYDALKVLQKVWAASGGQCGKYLAASMRTQLGGLERHGELLDGVDRYSVAVRKELLSMSAASIDRYLKPAKAADQIRGVATTKPSPLLRSSIKIRKAGDEVEAEPGFFEGDTVAHCGPTLKGEFARTLNLTDVYTGWVFTRSVRNNAHVHILSALKAGVDAVPFAVTGLDFDNGTEFLNKAVIKWAATLEIFFTRSRPYKKNDQATIESKNNHLVRKYGFYYRYDTSEERAVLNRLWRLVNDRFNYLTPTKKPVGFGTDRNGRRTRLYDKPATPLDRLLAAKVLAPEQQAELTAYRDSLNPAAIARQIADLQAVLLKLAKDKTEQLYLASFPTALPDVRKGIRIKAS